MKHPKGIWLRRGLLPYYLTGHRLALALLLRDKPSTAAQLAAALTEKGYRTDPQTLEKSLARLFNLGFWQLLKGNVEVSDSVYRCTCEKLDAACYSESQLLDLVGMTQSTVNGTAFYTTTPPPSVSSRGPSGS